MNKNHNNNNKIKKISACVIFTTSLVSCSGSGSSGNSTQSNTTPQSGGVFLWTESEAVVLNKSIRRVGPIPKQTTHANLGAIPDPTQYFISLTTNMIKGSTTAKVAIATVKGPVMKVITVGKKVAHFFGFGKNSANNEDVLEGISALSDQIVGVSDQVEVLQEVTDDEFDTIINTNMNNHIYALNNSINKILLRSFGYDSTGAIGSDTSPDTVGGLYRDINYTLKPFVDAGMSESINTLWSEPGACSSFAPYASKANKTVNNAINSLFNTSLSDWTDVKSSLSQMQSTLFTASTDPTFANPIGLINSAYDAYLLSSIKIQQGLDMALYIYDVTASYNESCKPSTPISLTLPMNAYATTNPSGNLLTGLESNTRMIESGFLAYTTQPKANNNYFLYGPAYFNQKTSISINSPIMTTAQYFNILGGGKSIFSGWEVDNSFIESAVIEQGYTQAGTGQPLTSNLVFKASFPYSYQNNGSESEALATSTLFLPQLNSVAYPSPDTNIDAAYIRFSGQIYNRKSAGIVNQSVPESLNILNAYTGPLSTSTFAPIFTISTTNSNTSNEGILNNYGNVINLAASASPNQDYYSNVSPTSVAEAVTVGNGNCLGVNYSYTGGQYCALTSGGTVGISSLDSANSGNVYKFMTAGFGTNFVSTPGATAALSPVTSSSPFSTIYNTFGINNNSTPYFSAGYVNNVTNMAALITNGITSTSYVPANKITYQNLIAGYSARGAQFNVDNTFAAKGNASIPFVYMSDANGHFFIFTVQGVGNSDMLGGSTTASFITPLPSQVQNVSSYVTPNPYEQYTAGDNIFKAISNTNNTNIITPGNVETLVWPDGSYTRLNVEQNTNMGNEIISALVTASPISITNNPESASNPQNEGIGIVPGIGGNWSALCFYNPAQINNTNIGSMYATFGSGYMGNYYSQLTGQSSLTSLQTYPGYFQQDQYGNILLTTSCIGAATSSINGTTVSTFNLNSSSNTTYLVFHPTNVPLPTSYSLPTGCDMEDISDNSNFGMPGTPLNLTVNSSGSLSCQN